MLAFCTTNIAEINRKVRLGFLGLLEIVARSPALEWSHPVIIPPKTWYHHLDEGNIELVRPVCRGSIWSLVYAPQYSVHYFMILLYFVFCPIRNSEHRTG